MQDLRTVRQEKRLTQQDISGLTGLPQSHVSALENGHYLPNLRTRQRIEQLLGHSIDWQQTVSGDKDYITAKLVELINVQADGVLERIAHVKRILNEMEKTIQTH